MFNFNRNNNTTANTSTAGTSSAGNSFLSSSSWNTNNNSSASTGGFSFANNNNNQTNSTLGFPSTSSFTTNNNTTGLGSGAGFTFNTNNNNNATNNNMFSTGNTGNNSMLGSNNNTMFKFNTATTTTNNNNTLPSSSFASNNNPFATNSSSTSTFPAFSSSFNNNTMTTMNNSKPSFPSFVPTPFTASNGEKIKYYSLNKMEHYKDKSFEECRYDYWYAQKNGTLPSTTSSATTSNNTNNWMNSGSSLTSNNNSAWSMPSAISTGTTNPTTATNNSTFNFGLNSTSNTAATNNTTGNTLGSTNWLSNNNNGGSMFNTQPTNLFNTNNNNTTNTTNNGMFPSTNGTSNMFNTNPTTAPSTSTFNFSNGNTNNTLPTNNSSTFSFPSIGNNTAQPSMFNLGGSSNPTTANNSTYNFGLNPASTTTASNVNQPFSWNTSANNNNLTSTNPTTNGTSSFLSTSLPSFQPSTIGNNMFTNTNPTTIGNTSAFNFTNTANSNGMMTTANIPINSDATLLSVLNQPYGENSLYEEKYQPLAFMTKVESEEESTQDDKSSKELSASFCARPRLGKFKKPTLAEKLTLINNQAQMEEKQQTQENLFDDLAFRHKNSLKELTIFPNNAFNKNEKSIYPTIEENVIETHEERISSNTTIVKTSIHQGRASPPTNVDLVKPKAVKGMIFQSEEFHKKKDERVTVPKFLPKLTKEGYYTIPSMKELSMMGNADLKNCRNFTIGRHGYGEIQVLGYLDLTRGLDLDRIVCEIEKHHVDLYSNHSPNEKPQVGSELNRPCIITLFNVHPTTQNKSQPTTFEKMTQFQAKLKKANQKSGSEFINYSNGEWIFKVNHF